MPNDTDLAWRRVLTAVTNSPQPLTGRQVAHLAGVSPTTASRLLRQLQGDQLVTSVPKGRATFWRGTADAAETLVENHPRVTTRRALFLTALPLETAALKSLLPGSRTRREPSGVRSIESALVGSHISWQIRTIEGGVGNVAASAAAAHALDGFVPDIILFVGVAGGLKPSEQQHGDVVIVNRAYNASAGKEVVDRDGDLSFLTRPVSERIPLALEELARQVAGGMQLAAAIVVGPVASTEAVLGTVDGAIYQRIRSNLNDCGIVDMESYGVLVGARRVGVPAISIRGISDLVDDKTPGKDEERQPAAAKNAAKVALRLLRDADPSDVNQSSHQRPEHVVAGVEGQADEVTALEHGSLPASADPWYRQLLTSDPERAEQARIELLKWRRGAIATHVSRAVDRPPAWLRSDRTGEAWAMVAAIAGTAQSGVASRAHDEAARRALEAGMPEISGFHKISAILAALNDGAGESDDAEASIVSALSELDLHEAPNIDVFRTILLAQTRREGGDWKPALVAAAAALPALGIDLEDVGLVDCAPKRSLTEAPDQQAITGRPSRAPHPAIRLPQPVRDFVAGLIALHVATLHIYADRGVAALQAADTAGRLLPGSAAARIRRGQALLTILHGASGADNPGIGRESEVLAEVERLALQAHATVTEWDGAGAESLALAGRALMEGGDPDGALRILRPPPHGTANPREAASSDVIRIVVPSALMVGDHELALRAAQQMEGTTEALLMKAQALERARGMRHEAREAYLQALAARGDDRSTLERALMGLARLGEALHAVESTQPPPGSSGDSTPTGETKATLRSALRDLREQNAAMADICIGTAALQSGDAQRALALARRHRDRIQGVELAADAYEALGERDKAVELSWDYGIRNGDVAVQLESIMRAGRQGDFDRVAIYADLMIRDHSGQPRRMARRARLRAAGMTNDWQTLDAQSRLLLEESAAESGLSITDREAASLRWNRVEALFRLRQFRSAFEVMSTPTFASVDTRELAILALALTYSLVEQSVPLSGATIDWVLALASSWIDDEEVCRRAVGVLLMSGGDDDLARISRARDVIERYFERHKEEAQIRQIQFDGDLDPDNDEVPEGYFEPLWKELKRTSKDRAPQFDELRREVWLGRLPWAMFVDLLDRNYASSLIQGGSGQHVLSSQWAPAPSKMGIDAAREALADGNLTVDPSALVIAPRLGASRRDLLGLFQKVHLAAAHREDMFKARAELERRNEMTLGWDSREDRPRIFIASPEDLDRWAQEAADLCECLPLVAIQIGDNSREDTHGLDALLLAEKLGTPLWVDDAAIRSVAQERSVPSFTTLDLIEALADSSDVIRVPTPQDIRRAARASRIVDVPLTDEWWVLAREDSWHPELGTALAISRPAAWQDPVASFKQFQRLVDVLSRQPKDVASIETIAHWTATAAHGLAWALNPSLRARMTSNLFAWVVLNHEPALNAERLALKIAQVDVETSPEAGRLLSLLYDAMRRVAQSAFPAADSVRELTSTLASTVRSVADAPTTMRIMLEALGHIQDQTLRDDATRALLIYPPTPDT